jgi:hypothetical protein
MSEIIYAGRHGRGDGEDAPAANVTDAEELALLPEHGVARLELFDVGPTTAPLPHLEILDCGPVLGLDFEPAYPRNPCEDFDFDDPRSNEEQLEEIEDPSARMLGLADA